MEEVVCPMAMCKHSLLGRATWRHNLLFKASTTQCTNIQLVELAKEELDQPRRPSLPTTLSQVPGITTSTWAWDTSTMSMGWQ